MFGREIKSQTLVATRYVPPQLISFTAAVPLIGHVIGGFTFESVGSDTRLSRWTEMERGRGQERDRLSQDQRVVGARRGHHRGRFAASSGSGTRGVVMKPSVRSTMLCLLLAACGGSGSTSLVPSSVPAQAGPATTPPASVPATASSIAASASRALSSPNSGTFILCRAPNAGPTCPLSPGLYRAAIHDAYTLTIKDTEWQEERPGTPAEEEPTVILSRTDSPGQQLSIDTGQTGNLLDVAGMASLVAGTATFQMTAPLAVHVGTADEILGVASGFQVDLAPTEARQVTVSGAGTYAFKPGHRYRLLALQLPMLADSGIKVIIVDAPTPSFDAFLPLANAILQSVHFENPA
jgi:hypothetical protein